MANSPNHLHRLDEARVLVIFGGDRIFGSERANLEVFRNMAQLGLKARFITNSRWGGNEIQPELNRLGFEWTTAPFGFHWGKYFLGKHFYYFFINIYGVIITSWRLLREIRHWNPTHLYLMNWEFFTYVAPTVLASRLPLVYRAGDDLPVHSVFHRWVTQRLLNRVDAVVCISRFIEERLVAAGLARKKSRVIYNYPPERDAAATPVLPAIPEGAIVITFLGQLSEHKGVLVLLDAVEQMIQRGRNVVLWLVGNQSWGTDFDKRLKERTAAARLQGRVDFFGFVRNVFPILERTDIHVCPSLFEEPLSNVVGEAKKCGKPSVVFRSGGLPELIEHKIDGFICRERTPEALAEGIEYFITDRDARLKAGEEGRRSLVLKFSLEEYRRRWAEVFHDPSNEPAVCAGSDHH
jgi:glycosyltransferase involved in cell wall biosynthesis